MKETLQDLKNRRSVRKFKPDMVAEEQLQEILEAGKFAACGMGRQAGLMVVVQDKETMEQLRKMNAAYAVGVDSCWIHRAKEEFESEEGKALLAKWGIEGDYAGIGHCILGYSDGPLPEAKPRKENFVVRV